MNKEIYYQWTKDNFTLPIKPIEEDIPITIEGVSILKLPKEFIDFYFRKTDGANTVISLYREQGERNQIEDEIKFLENLKDADILQTECRINNRLGMLKQKLKEKVK